MKEKACPDISEGIRYGSQQLFVQQHYRMNPKLLYYYIIFIYFYIIILYYYIIFIYIYIFLYYYSILLYHIYIYIFLYYYSINFPILYYFLCNKSTLPTPPHLLGGHRGGLEAGPLRDGHGEGGGNLLLADEVSGLVADAAGRAARAPGPSYPPGGKRMPSTHWGQGIFFSVHVKMLIIV